MTSRRRGFDDGGATAPKVAQLGQVPCVIPKPPEVMVASTLVQYEYEKRGVQGLVVRSPGFWVHDE